MGKLSCVRSWVKVCSQHHIKTVQRKLHVATLPMLQPHSPNLDFGPMKTQLYATIKRHVKTAMRKPHANTACGNLTDAAMRLAVYAARLSKHCHQAEVFLCQCFEHWHEPLADVGVKILELAWHVGQGCQTVGVQVFVLNKDEMAK